MRKANLPHIKTVRSHGRVYEYFNTGQKLDGKPVYVRLPSKRDPNFGTAYATQLANRTKRAKVESVMLFADLARRYMLSKKFLDRAEGTQRAYVFYIKELIANFGEAPITDISRPDIRLLMERREAQPVACRALLNVFRQIVAFAKSKDWLTVDVSEGIEVEHEKTPYQPWPEALLEKALADPAIRLPVALLYYTDQRIGDVCKMRWSHIQDDVIEVRQQKTGKSLYIPLHAELRAILADEQKGLTTILKDRKGRQRTPVAVGRQIDTWLAANGGKGFVPHGLRKNGVNALLEAGCTVAEVSAISGQSLQMVEHYSRQRDTRKAAGNAMRKWEQTK